MFLLFQFLRYHHGFCFQDLHSNMFLLFPFYPLGTHSFRKLIYIPICFYYFQYRGFTVPEIDKYLHSNMFLLFRGLIVKLNVSVPFTFQYVSIISHFRLCTTVTKFNLHSNMFLLFRSTNGSARSLIALFTFQYVSIISISLELLLQI